MSVVVMGTLMDYDDDDDCECEEGIEVKEPPRPARRPSGSGGYPKRHSSIDASANGVRCPTASTRSGSSSRLDSPAESHPPTPPTSGLRTPPREASSGRSATAPRGTPSVSAAFPPGQERTPFRMSSAGSNQARAVASFCALSAPIGNIPSTQEGPFPGQAPPAAPPSPQHASSMSASLTMPMPTMPMTQAQAQAQYGTSPTNRCSSQATAQHTPSFGFVQNEAPSPAPAAPGPQTSPRTSNNPARKLRSVVHAVQMANRLGHASSGTSSSSPAPAAPAQGSPMLPTRTVQSQAPVLPMCPTRTAPATYVQPAPTPQASPIPEQPKSFYLERIFGIGDMLFVRGSEGGIMDIGAAGGWFGHVMVFAETPEKITRDSEEYDAFSRIWPAGATEIYLVKCVESTRSRAGLSEQRFLFHVEPTSGKFSLIGEVDYETHTIALSGEDMEIWKVPKELRKRVKRHSNIAEQVLDAMKKSWSNWSWHTAFRSVVSHSHMSTFRNKEEVLSKVKEMWEREPICTSVMITFWQRCLAMLADTSDSSEDMGDLIMKYMPVKCDRTLPGALLAALRERGWAQHQAPPEKAQTNQQWRESDNRQQANPRYCPRHNTSDKRPKLEKSIWRNCEQCGVQINATYQQISYCHACSDELEACCICKEHVGEVGTYKPSAVAKSHAGPLQPFQPVVREPESGEAPSCEEAFSNVDFTSQPASVQVPISGYESSMNGGSASVPVTAGWGGASFAVASSSAGTGAGASAAVSVASVAYPPMEVTSLQQPLSSPRTPHVEVVVGRSMTAPVGDTSTTSTNPRHCSNHDETGKRKKAEKARNLTCKHCQQAFLIVYEEFVYCPACSDACEACMNCGAPAPPGKVRGGASLVPIPSATSPARPAAVSNFC